MISVGSRDGKEGLSSRYGGRGGKMELETEIEEGEACFQNNNGDDSTIDPDISLSYIDEKIQNVLGHCQKDFEGGVSAENLGAKFGGYGSFLPTYQRSPLLPHPKVLTHDTPVSPNEDTIVGHQNFVSQSIASQTATNGQVSAPKGESTNDKLKQQVPTSTNKSTSNGQRVSNDSDQKSLKVRIKLGSDNMSSKRNAEIYSGLGLDGSPSSSFEASPVNSDGFFHVPDDGPEESPTSILEIMTSFPVCGSLLLSPLSYDVLHLTENEKGSQESSVTALHVSDLGKVDRDVLEKKKPKLSEKNTFSMESTNGNDVCNGIGVLAMNKSACEELVSNSRRLSNNADFGKNDDLSDIAKEEPLDRVLTRDDCDRNGGSVGKIWEDKNTNCDEKKPVFATKADSDASNGSKTRDTKLVKPLKGAQKAMSHEKDKKKSKKSRVFENGSRNLDVSRGGLKNDSLSTSKSKNNDDYGSKRDMEDMKRNNGKVRETYKDFFGELDLEHEDDDDDDDNTVLEKPSGVEKGTLESNSSSKERLIGKKSKKQSSGAAALTVGSHAVPTIANGSVSGAAVATMGSHAVPTIANVSVSGAAAVTVGSHAVPTIANGSVSGAAAATVAPLVNEDWVCCDKCEKWRLLPPGVNPGSLPEKWLCSMLDWLPGMNRCSIGEEETTKAITSRFPGPPIVQGYHPVHPGAPQPGVVLVGAPCLDQTHQLLGSQAPSLKKKHEPKDLLNETKPDRPSMSSNSAKKNLQTLYKSRSLNGVNGSSVNEVEFQDSGRSSDVIITEKRRLKHEQNNKLCENFVDEGGNNTNQSKISNKREMIQDYPKDRKKIKTDEDWTSDHGGAVFKASCSSSSGLPAGVSRKDRLKHGQRPKDTKSGSKVLAINPEKQNQISSNDSKKRKANEFVEEMSETDDKKEKKSRVLKPEKGKNVKDEQVTGLDPGPVRATSSSSKVSGSRKTKSDNQGTKGSPGESVSSSPLRILNRNKVTSSRRNKINPKTSESLNENVDIKNPKWVRNKSDKFENDQSKHRHNDRLDVRTIEAKTSQDVKKPSKPPSGKVQIETERLPQPVYRKDNAGKTSEQNKKTQNHNGNQPINIKHPTPSPPKRETSNQAATNALREATNLKHMADRVKNSGSNLESRALYMQAALKFLNVASLFESCHSQTGRYGDMIQSMSIYSSTAKLCEFCAHEYEKTKETAIAALAYKCMEVAYLKVVYSSHSSACKDLHELQTLGESPSSSASASASDLDNLNNPATVDKTALPKGVNSPQVAGNHVIAARNKPNFTRILNFAQDVNLAMEASRKSRIAFVASGLKEETGLSAVKTALDFNFHDVEELLRLVRLAMEVINR